LFLSILTTPSLVVAQLSHTPLPPIPAAQPLYPSAQRSRPVLVRTEAPTPRVARPVFAAKVAPPILAPIAPSPAPIVVAHVAKPVAIAPAPTAPVPTLLPARGLVLPPNTDVLVRLDEEVSSKAKRVGDAFRLTVVQDVIKDGTVVIPRGTPVVGSVVWRTGKGMFGKSAKMEIAIDQLTLNGQAVPLFGRFREEGEGNTGATIGTAVAAGVIAAAFITGRSAVFPAGREFRVTTREAFAFGTPQAVAPALIAAVSAAPE